MTIQQIQEFLTAARALQSALIEFHRQQDLIVSRPHTTQLEYDIMNTDAVRLYEDVNALLLDAIREDAAQRIQARLDRLPPSLR